MQLVLFIGIQATGKSSFYQERFSDTHIRLNLDMLRTRRRERLLFEACLAAKQPVVIDNTNPTRLDRSRYVAPALAAGFRVIGYFFESRVPDAIRRNAQRLPERQIPVRGIKGTSNRLELPSREEGFAQLFFVRLVEETRDFEVGDWRDEV